MDQSSYRGNEETLDSNHEKLKLRYILGANLAGCNDPLSDATFQLKVADGERVQNLPLKQLRGWLAHMISDEKRNANARSNNSARGDDNHAGRDKRGHDGNAGQGPLKRAKDETVSTGTPRKDNDGEAKRTKTQEWKKKVAGRECFKCGQTGHIKADCTADGKAKQQPTKPAPTSNPKGKQQDTQRDTADYSKRDKRVVAAFHKVMEQLQEPEGKQRSKSDVLEALTSELGTAMGVRKQGQPGQVGELGRGKGKNAKKAALEDDDSEGDRDD